MPRPTTKQDLITLANNQNQKLWELINSMSENDQNRTFNFSDNIGKEAHWKRDKNIKDLLIHLYEWHQLLLNWVKSNQNGEAKPFLPEGYSWKTYGDMNIMFWEKHQKTSYAKAKEMFETSHLEVINLINQFNDEELFTKKYFTWTGTTTLGQYCTSVTSSHYDWAIKKIKAHLKTLK